VFTSPAKSSEGSEDDVEAKLAKLMSKVIDGVSDKMLCSLSELEVWLGITRNGSMSGEEVSSCILGVENFKIFSLSGPCAAISSTWLCRRLCTSVVFDWVPIAAVATLFKASVCLGRFRSLSTESRVTVAAPSASFSAPIAFCPPVAPGGGSRMVSSVVPPGRPNFKQPSSSLWDRVRARSLDHDCWPLRLYGVDVGRSAVIILTATAKQQLVHPCANGPRRSSIELEVWHDSNY
jgi:hypothetical protein